MKPSFLLASLISFSLLTTPAAFAAETGDMALTSSDIYYSHQYFFEGQTYKIYATATSNSNRDLLGIVRFYDNGGQIGGDQVISIIAGKTDAVFIDWVPNFGSHNIDVKLFPWEPAIDNPGNNTISSSVYVEQDTDYDGITNENDIDDDGDGIIDQEDAFPLDKNEQRDTDGDGIGDNSDDDDDGDGVPDEFDDLPLNPNETIDTDKDGTGNISDKDDDNDGLDDNEEVKIGTDTLKVDTDEDGESDKTDPFPLDPREWRDTDHDLIGNNQDTDDDNDGLPDETDEFPLNKGPVIKLSTEDFEANVYEKFTLDAAPSFDEDGEIVTYLWEIDGRRSREGNAITHTFETVGDHDVELIIIDDDGEQRSMEFQVSVKNLKLYGQILASLGALLLALIIYFKYIRVAKKRDEAKKPTKTKKS
jgi:hypothetical protein